MQPKSSSLFHFTRSLDFLKGILSRGFLPRYSLEDTRYLGVDFYAFPMSCFCDIPISRIQEHSLFYGEYGLGMTKDWGARNSLEPLIYAPGSGTVAKVLEWILDIEKAKLHESSHSLYESLAEHWARLFTLTKPVSGNMMVGGTVVEKDFYQENEWRYVPIGAELLTHDEFKSKRDEMNLLLEEHALKFAPGDVKYIFVKTDAEIPTIFDFIQNNFGQWPLNEVKILSSRITSLETIAKDL